MAEIFLAGSLQVRDRRAHHRDMEVRSVDAVLRGLASGGVRYLVAGGLAFVARGHVRFTKDIAPDLPVRFVSRNDLLAMKRRAGRPQDVLGIEALNRRWNR